MQIANRIERMGMPLAGRRLEELQRLYRIGLGAQAHAEHVPQIDPGPGMLLIRSRAIPAQGLGMIDRHAPAITIEVAQFVLAVGFPLACNLATGSHHAGIVVPLVGLLRLARIGLRARADQQANSQSQR